MVFDFRVFLVWWVYMCGYIQRYSFECLESGFFFVEDGRVYYVYQGVFYSGFFIYEVGFIVFFFQQDGLFFEGYYYKSL